MLIYKIGETIDHVMRKINNETNIINEITNKESDMDNYTLHLIDDTLDKIITQTRKKIKITLKNKTEGRDKTIPKTKTKTVDKDKDKNKTIPETKTKDKDNDNTKPKTNIKTKDNDNDKEKTKLKTKAKTKINIRIKINNKVNLINKTNIRLAKAKTKVTNNIKSIYKAMRKSQDEIYSDDD